MRIMRVAVLLVTLGGLGGCDSAQPCPICPALNGTWALSWTDGYRPSGCAAQGPRPAMLNLVQSQSDLRTIVDGQTLKGTIVDTWDFTLHGGTTPMYSMHGSATADGTDGGVHIEGTLSVIDAECTFNDKYLGQKL